MSLKTDYVNDVLNTDVNTKRRYNMITNSDGTVSFEDVTTYTTEGDTFGAGDINDTNEAVNTLDSTVSDLSTTVSDLGSISDYDISVSGTTCTLTKKTTS